MSSRGIPNLDPEQLDCFLGIVTDRTDSILKSSDDQAVVDSVHKVLTSPLGNHSAFPDLLQDRLRHFTQAFSDKSLIDMVLDSRTEPIILKAISYCAQEYSVHVSTQAENAIAITIYYAATASLLVHHHKEIAEDSYENLIESFTDLMKKRWLVPTLKPHFDRACKICQQRQGSEETDKKRLSNEELLKLDDLSTRRKSTSNNATSSLDLLVDGAGGWIGRYKLLHVLGEGGMGIVYLAEQEQPIRRRVALKVIKPGMDSKRVIARFETERQALALLDHPNIAHVHDAGTTPTGRPYFVMEYVQGLPITEHCDKHKLTMEERLRLFQQICDAVQYAHQKGLIHRDIKPSNILVSTEWDKAIPKIIDFGVAKAVSHALTERTLLTQDSQLLGTPEYMSPEQADMANEDIDTRSDIYSLGVLLYVLLTGVLPFDSASLREGGMEHIRQVIRETDPKTPSTRLARLGDEAKTIAQNRRMEIQILAKHLRKELEWIPLKAMRKERSERYRSASEIAEDIENYLRNDPLIAGPPGTMYRLKKLVRRHKALVGGTFIVLVVSLIGTVVSIIFALGQARAHAEAQAVSDFLRNSVLASLDPFKVGGREITIRSVLDAASKSLGREFKGTPLAEAEIQDTLGNAYWSLGLYKQAESHLKRALDIQKALRGSEHPATLASMHQLGWVYFAQSRYLEAERFIGRVWKIRSRVMGEEHSDTLYSMMGLACVYFMQGRFQEAEQLAGKGLETTRRELGPEHWYVPGFMNVLAITCRLQGRYKEAERLVENGLQIARRTLGENHWFTLLLKQNRGSLYTLLGHYDSAEEALQEVFNSRREAWGQEHPDTLETMAELGWLYLNQGRYKKAEDQLRKTLEATRRVLGNEQLYSLYSMHGLGTLYLSQGRYDEAEPLLDEVLGIASHVMGEETWFTLRIMNTRARLYTAQGRYEEADKMFQQTLTARRRIWDANHPEIYETMNDLAILYKEQERYEEAEELLNEAVDGRRLKLGDTHPHTLESWHNLIDLYKAWNKPEKANKWREELQIEKS